MPTAQYASNTVGGTPFGNERINPEGSPYLSNAPTALNAEATHVLERAIANKIIPTTPNSYWDALKLLFLTKPPESFSDDVYSWDEVPDQRMAITVDNGVATAGTQLFAATAAVAGASVTRTVPVPAAMQQYIAINSDVVFQDGSIATVTAKTPGGNTITLTSLTGKGIPAIVQGHMLPQAGEIRADGMEGWKNVQRTGLISRFNYVATIMRASKYGRKELLKYLFNERTNYLQTDMEELVNQLRFDVLVQAFVGRKDVRILDTGEPAKGFDGLVTQMVNGNSTFGTCSVSNLQASFESIAQETNHKSKGGVRDVYAPQAVLTLMSKLYKDHKVRLENQENYANLDLEGIRFGGQTYRFCPVEPFANPHYFPEVYRSRMLVVDTDSVVPVVQKGLPMFDIAGAVAGARGTFNELPQKTKDAITRRDYSVRDVEFNGSLKVTGPQGSFALDITNL